MLNNTKGYTSTSGPATEFVISGAPGDARAITAVMTNMQVKTFYITIGNNFMLFKGRYETAGTKVVIVDIINSSHNDNETVTWPAGLKVLRVVASVEDMTDMEQMVAGATKKIFTAAQETRVNGLNDEFDAKADFDDPRLNATDVNAMTPAVVVAGTEKVAGSTLAGDPVSLTPSLIMGNPFRHLHGHLKDRYRHYSVFNRMRPGYAATNGALMDLEPYITYFSGAGGAAILQLMGFAFYKNLPVLAMNTGSNTNGYCGFRHVQPLSFDPTQIIDELIAVGPSTLPNTSGQNYTLQFGRMFYDYANGTLAPRGLSMPADPSFPNWRGVVQNAGGTSFVDTGVPVAISAIPSESAILRMYYDPDDTLGPATKFSVNNSAFVSIPNATRVLATDQELFSAIQLVKSSGNTATSCLVGSHSSEAQNATLSDYLANYP